MSVNSSSQIIIFSDLDGTLLDEKTYSPASSIQALRYLQENSIKIVFCSSKTRKEQEILRNTLQVNDPFIVENGSAIIIPSNTIAIRDDAFEERDGKRIITMGKTIEQIRLMLNDVQIETGLTIETFCDLSASQIAQITGLDIDSAKLAKDREYSATVVTKFEDHELTSFLDACKKQNLQCAFGGRFMSITGKGADKGNAVGCLTAFYQAQFGNIITVGIGDSPNDAPMLQAVDYPYLVQRPNGEWRHLDIPNLTRIPAIGPLGFTAMVNDLKTRWLE